MKSNPETRTTMADGLCGFTSEVPALVDLGHPLVNRVAECFVKAAGIGAIQAVSREAYFSSVKGTGLDSSEGSKEAALSSSQRGDQPKIFRSYGLAAGVYSGITYGLKEARGTHDWKNSAVTGMALALTAEDSSHEQVAQCAITGAAISTALTGIF